MRYKHKDNAGSKQMWTQTPRSSLVTVVSVGLTSWHRPPSCRWPSVWASAPDVWQTPVLANGGPKQTFAKRPTSRTNPLRWPNRYCRRDGEGTELSAQRQQAHSDGLVFSNRTNEASMLTYFGNSVKVCKDFCSFWYWSQWRWFVSFTGGNP